MFHSRSMFVFGFSSIVRVCIIIREKKFSLIDNLASYCEYSLSS